VKSFAALDSALISTIDFFYPSVEDPYMQGRIACCNVLSDLYSMGVDSVDTILMVLGVSNRMKENEQEIVTRLMIQGFDECAQEAGTSVQGGQTVYNPWPMIGGVGIAFARNSEFVLPNKARAGQKILLTKALGTQVAVNVQ